MIKPTLITVWPVHVDYPLFRYNLHRFQKWFDKVVIAFSNLNQEESYRSFIVKDLPFADTVPAIGNRKDWRDNAVNSALGKYSNSAWYLFVEQDFLIKDDRLFEVILNTSHDYRFVYYKEDGRIHPAFALVEGELIAKTSKNFSANPPVNDHFGFFFREVQNFTEGTDIENLGLVNKEDFYHLAGLTQNYACFKNNQPFFKPEEFLTYNGLTLDMMENYDFTFHDSFFHLTNNIAVQYGRGGNPETLFLKEFFPKGVKQ